MDERQEKMLRDVHEAVIGNDNLGHEGLVRGFQRHDKWIRSADIKIATFFGGFAVIIFLIELYFKK